MSDYFKKLDYISNSMLGWLDRSPAYYLQKLSYNAEEKETKSLEYGKLLHTYFEKPDAFIVEDFEKPTGKAGEFLDAYFLLKDIKKAKDKINHGWSEDVLKNKVLDSKDGQKYLDFLKLSSDRLALTKDQKYKLDGAIKSLNNNPLVTELLYSDLESYNEQEIYWEENPYINNTQYEVKCKGKLDKIILDHKKKKIIIIDLKSTSDTPYGNLVKTHSTSDPQIDYKASGWFISFMKYKYYRQAGMYTKAINVYFKDLIKDDYKIEFIFIVSELGKSFDTAVYKVSDTMIGYGIAEVDRLITDYNFYKQMNEWNIPQQYKKIRII